MLKIYSENRRTKCKDFLHFCFITDYDFANNLSIFDQVKIAIASGATTVQYRNKNFSPKFYNDVIKIKTFCRDNGVMFVVNDDIILAKAVNADGIHLGQNDESIILARKILGPKVIIGLSISTLKELNKKDLSCCDYIGFGPVFPTKTKIDAKAPQGIDVLSKIAAISPIPIVAIGGITAINALSCINCGAYGVAVISYISRSKDPLKAASKLANNIY